MSWGSFDMLSDQIIENYRDAGIKKIVGLTRGGLPLAVKISNVLGIPMETLSWQTRDGNTQEVTKLLKLNRAYNINEVLFVDEICDSGRTINEINLYFPLAMFTVLIDKVPEQGLVDYTPEVKWVHEDKRIVFPWEKE